MKKRALVTGASGMDGHLLCNLLISKDYLVIGTLRPQSDQSRLRLNPKVTYLEIDLANQEDLMSLLKQNSFDEIYNLGAQSAIAPSWKNPEETLKVNASAIITILSYIRDFAPNTRFFNAASSEMYGEPNHSPQDEHTEFSPRNPYGAVKLLAHNLIGQFRGMYDLFACSGILYNHESPHRSPSIVTRKITMGVAKISLGGVEKIKLGSLTAVRDWGAAEDFIEAMWLTLQHGVADDYVIATGVGRTIRDFVKVSFQSIGISDFEKHIEIDPAFIRPDERVPLVGDNKRIKAIGWQPKMSFEKMITQMVLHDIELLKNDKNSISM